MSGDTSDTAPPPQVTAAHPGALGSIDAMRRPTIPLVFRELADEPGSLRILAVAAIALFASGLDPKV